MNYNFDVNIAVKYGVNAAIFLNNIAFWILKNIANKKHFYDGTYWTYNSIDSFSHLFPFWSSSQLRTIIKRCESEGLLLKGNYNDVKYDQTSWYALTPKGLVLFNISINESLTPPELPICQNSQMDLTRIANQFDKNRKPIPDIKPDIKTIKREKKKPKPSHPSPKLVPLKFKPSQDQIEFAEINKLDITYEKKEFIRHYQDKGEKKLKWIPTFTKWMERSIEWRNKKEQEENSRQTYRDKPIQHSQQQSQKHSLNTPRNNEYVPLVNIKPAINDPARPEWDRQQALKDKQRQSHVCNGIGINCTDFLTL